MKSDAKAPGSLWGLGKSNDGAPKVHFLTSRIFLQLALGDKVYIRLDQAVDGCGGKAILFLLHWLITRLPGTLGIARKVLSVPKWSPPPPIPPILYVM